MCTTEDGSCVAPIEMPWKRQQVGKPDLQYVRIISVLMRFLQDKVAFPVTHAMHCGTDVVDHVLERECL